MSQFFPGSSSLGWEHHYEKLLIEAWGPNSLRVRATHLPPILDLPGALLPPPPSPEVQIEVLADGSARIQNGKIRAVVSAGGRLEFTHSLSGQPLLAEPPFDEIHPPARYFKSLQGDLFRLEARFEPVEGERFYGLGQHQHGRLDQKGCVIDLVQRNTEVSIPFTLSSRGYGFLWHNPAVGRVELAANGTRWTAGATRQLDYWLTAGDTPAEIMFQYAQATGFPLMLPDWAAGFWQSKLRYTHQAELIEVAREHQYRGLPLAVIVVDGLHWTLMGDWKFDSQFWPDPAALAAELEDMGVKLMVSIWPTVNPLSANYARLREAGLLVRTERGVPAQTVLVDTHPQGPVYLTHYDATHPQGRRFIWEQVRQNYYAHGVKVFWLDADEPEFYPTDHENLRFHLGSGAEVGGLFPLLHQQAFFEGLAAEGEQEIITLSRSAWAGSQRYGGAVWSGDVDSTFEALQMQVRAGLNIALSGIPWWTTDIGGFKNGDPRTPYFRELVVRWFQYGVFCPLFRLHGFRLPLGVWNGADNEVWTFGDEAYTLIREILFLRERLRPYIMEQMRLAHTRGIPPMRPLFFDFPHDPACTLVDDQFLFGPDLLVAPVLHEGALTRSVYLPAGTHWRDAWTGQRLEGGQTLTADAPLARIPVYVRADQDLPLQTT